MARPRLIIDQTVVEGMASVGATDREISEFVGCSVDTLTRRFADILTKSRADMRVRLRRAQITLALEGNATMQIWLGKQILQQADQQTIKVGPLDKLSDDELKALAAGKLPSE